MAITVTDYDGRKFEYTHATRYDVDNGHLFVEDHNSQVWAVFAPGSWRRAEFTEQESTNEQ